MSFCCKGGKAAVLQPTRRYATSDGGATATAHIFLDTLVCHVDPRARLLQMPDPLPLAGGRPGLARGPLATTSMAVAGGAHVAWKQDAFDAALPAEQAAGGCGVVEEGAGGCRFDCGMEVF